MIIGTDGLQRRISIAAKREKADLVIKNGGVVDVFNQEIIYEDIAIADGVIVGMGVFEGIEEIDATGRFICPSFIDSHVHIESSMVIPSEFSKVVVPHGVTTIVADPHEIANVSGVEGIQFMLDSSENLPLNVFYMLPSCVPATPFENAGSVLTADDLRPFYQHPRVLGLGEVMDYPSVLQCDEGMLKKLSDAIKLGKKIDGHAAGLDAKALNVYATAGIKTDHETVSVQEALERLRRGMYLIIRQGSVAKDLPNLIEVVTDKNARRCLFGTDDKHIDDLIHEGSIDHNVRLAIKHGVHPINAIQMASLSAAECYGLITKGAVAPGYDADLLILNNLEQIEIDQVYSKGVLVAEKGNYLPADVMSLEPPTTITQSININPISKIDLQIKLEGTNFAHVIEIIPNSLVTKHVVEEVSVINGEFDYSIVKDQLKLAIFERHHRTGNVGLGIVKGLSIKNGAIATTIAHDSHNLIVAGTNDEDILFAISSLEEQGGGLIVVENQKVLASLPLKLAGIISGNPYQEIYNQLHEIKDALKKIEASEQFNPFLTLSFLALPVIPELKLTDMGLFDVKSFKHIEIASKNREV
ncbi:adenine deaminase [Bacillus sp. AK128]